MTVTFTSNIALAKPSLAEVAKNWVTGPQLAQDNNLIIIDKTDITMQSYTPTIIGATTNPNVGTGSTLGKFQRNQGFVFGYFVILFTNTGISAGSGEYGISLPSLADPVFHSASSSLSTGVGGNACIGEGYIQDNSSVANCGSVSLELCLISGVNYVRLVTEAIAAKSSRVVRDTVPFTVDHADTLAGQFFYKEP